MHQQARDVFKDFSAQLAAHAGFMFNSLCQERIKGVVINTSSAPLQLQPVNSALLFRFALYRVETLESNTF